MTSNQIQITQLDAYTTNLARFNKKEKQMLALYEENPRRTYTDQMLAVLLGWKLSCVNGRRNSLVKKGKLKQAGKIRNPETGIANILWGLA